MRSSFGGAPCARYVVVALALAAISCATRTVPMGPVPPQSIGESLDGPECAGFPVPTAYEELLSTEVFAWPLVGFVGRPSRQACAFAALSRSPDARSLFVQLMEDAELAGQLYALCGLYSLSREDYFLAADRFLYRDDLVWTVSGCVTSQRSVGNIAQWIDSGQLPESFQLLGDLLSTSQAQSSTRLD